MKRFVLVMMAVLIGTPSAVLAHAHLIRSTPQDGSEISAPVGPMVLYFTEALEQRLINVALSRDDKAVSGLSQPVLSGNGRIVNVSLPHLSAGLHTVSWSVVSIDGHRTEGKFTFLYRGP
ncbi:copper resistance CopC family protein [Bradyrhizobium sp. USDA 3315]